MSQLDQNINVEKNEVEGAVEQLKVNSIQLDEESNKISKSIFKMKYLPNDEQIGVLFKVEKIERVNSTEQPPNSSIIDCSFNGKTLLVHSITITQKFEESRCFLAEYDLIPVIKYSPVFTLYSLIDCYVVFNDSLVWVDAGYIEILEKVKYSNQYEEYKSIREGGKYLSVFADNENIYIMDTQFRIHIYDWHLQFIKIIGQNHNEKSPFYIRMAEQIEIRNKKFYTRMSNEIRIIDVNDGSILNTINIKSHKFTMNDDDNELIIFGNDSISRYQLDSGEFISKIDTTGSIPDDFRFLDYKDNKYILLSNNRKELYSVTL
jgi:hypothetical protein